MNEYKEDEDWNEYTYIEKYLLPPLNEYIEYLEREIIARNKKYSKSLNDLNIKAEQEAKISNS